MKVKMSQSFLQRFFLLIGLGYLVLFPKSSQAETLCDKFATANLGNYTVMNNKWGTDATQCISLSNNGFKIIQQDGVNSFNGAPVSYPAIYAGCHFNTCSPKTNLPMKLSDISNAMAVVNLTYPSSGVYDAAFDIWLNPSTDTSKVQQTEIMIWFHHTGSIQPIGSNTNKPFNAAGHTWQVYVGNNGLNNVVSYVTEGVSSFNSDIKPFLMDAITRSSGFGSSSWYLTSVQMGFEPWQGGVGLSVDAFSLNIQSGANSSSSSSGNGSSSGSSDEQEEVTIDQRPNSGTNVTSWLTKKTVTIINKGSKKCIDARAAEIGNGVIVQQFICNGTFAQQWYIEATTGETIKIANRNSPAQVLDVAGKDENSLIQLWSFGSGKNQQWKPISEGNGYFHFVNLLSGQCLDVPASNNADWLPLDQHTCNGTLGQSFRLAEARDLSNVNWYKIINQSSSLCLDINNTSAINMGQKACRNTPSQQWSFTPIQQNGVVQVVNRSTGALSKNWYLVPEGGRYYHFMDVLSTNDTKSTGNCLESKDGGQFTESKCNGSISQSFKFKKLK